MSNELECSDVAIIGGGPAGLAAGLFTARYGLRTRIFDRGPSRLKQCAYLDNYLGFPRGIDAGEFLRLARRQAIQAGCVVTVERVVALERGGERFVVRTGTAAYAAMRVVTASGYDPELLRSLDDGRLFDTLGTLRVDEVGRTACDGLYAAGPLAGVEDQALICAGHGARVALALLHDARRGRFRWEPLARHLDWQVRKGVYDSERWAARVHDHFQTECRPREADDAEFCARVDDWIGDKRKQQLTRDELASKRLPATQLRAAAEPPASGRRLDTP